MKKTILLVLAILCLADLSGQSKNDRPISVSGGPLIRYQDLNGLSGIYLGGFGCFQLNESINITAQGVLLANGKSFNPPSGLESLQTEDLHSGFGG